MEVNVLGVSGQSQRSYTLGLLPQDFPRVGLDSHYSSLFFIPRPVFVCTIRRVPDIRGLRPEIFPPYRRISNQQEQHTIRSNDLLGCLSAVIGANSPARRRVKHNQRGIESECNIDAVPYGDQSARKLGRAALERPEMSIPRRNRSLPQNRAVESVPRNEKPFRRQLDGSLRPFIDDVKDSSAGRYQRAHAGHVVVVPCPPWASDPLQMARWSDDRIVGHGITACIMHVMGPFVHLFGTRLDRFCPYITLLDVSGAVGHQNAQNLVHRDIHLLLRHDKVDKVVGVRQAVTSELFDRYLAVKLERLDMLTGLLDVLCIGVQAVDQVTVICAQCGCELTVPAVHVDYQAAFDTACV